MANDNDVSKLIPTVTVYNQYKKTDFVPTTDNLNPVREVLPDFIENLDEFQKQLYSKYKERVQRYFENSNVDETRIAAPIELGLPFAERTKIVIRPKLYNSGGAAPDAALIKEIAQKLGVNSDKLLADQAVKIPVLDIIKALPPQVDPIATITDIVVGKFPQNILDLIKNLPSDLNIFSLLQKITTFPEGILAELIAAAQDPNAFNELLKNLLHQDLSPEVYAQLKALLTSKNFPGPLTYIFNLPISNPEDLLIVLQAIQNLPAGASLDDLLKGLPPSVDLEGLLQEILINVDELQVVSTQGDFSLTLKMEPLSEIETLTAQLSTLVDSLIGGDVPLTIDDLPYDICGDRKSDQPNTGNEWLDALLNWDLQGMADMVLPQAPETDIRCILIELEFLKIILLLLQFLKAILQIEKIFLAIIYPIIDLIVKVVEAIFNPTKRARLLMDLAGQVFAILISWFFDYITSLLNNIGMNCLVSNSMQEMNSMLGTVKTVKDAGAEFKAFADFQTAQQKKIEESRKKINDILSETDKEKVKWDKLWAQTKSEAEKEINVRTQKIIKNYFLGDFEAY